jgi:hypothetical protein
MPRRWLLPELAVLILAVGEFSGSSPADGSATARCDRQCEGRALPRRAWAHWTFSSAVAWLARAQGPLAKRQPSVMPSNRSRPRHKVSVPGSPSDLRPRNPPSLAIMRMASRKLGAGASTGRFLFFLS